MNRKEKHNRAQQPPDRRFWSKLAEECRKLPGMVVKIEKLPRGKMANHKVKYVPACSLDYQSADMQILGWMGPGEYSLRFVDERRQILNKFGGVWLCLGRQSAMDCIDEELQNAPIDLIKAIL